ncbi:hypothetical protein [Emticicia fluvialis]|uniref:hypothetical protein n=1 Tax=Emticicia fluvialis TaxID=2974474 RepID=UPI002165868F|nr:hypothetical protein [Emticicia fluvialis]
MSKEFYHFIIHKYSSKISIWIGVFVFFVIILAIINKRNNLCSPDGWWSDVIDPVITIFGLVMPVLLWVFLLKNEWEENLDKKLTVHFKLKDYYVMSCFEVYLSSASDIRNWGQQIGQQMNSGMISFYPYLSQKGPEIKVDQHKKKSYLLYELTIYLKSDESGKYIPIAKGASELNPDEYKIWFDLDSEIAGYETLILKPQKVLPTLEEVKAEHFRRKL